MFSNFLRSSSVYSAGTVLFLSFHGPFFPAKVPPGTQGRPRLLESDGFEVPHDIG